MVTMDEVQAWHILEQYVDDCLQIAPGSLRAVYAVGPLVGGYFRPGMLSRPGQCDLSLILLAADESRPTWGRYFAPGPVLSILNDRYQRAYGLSSDSGASTLLESELYAPYLNGLAVPVIARLKMESRCLYGNFDLDSVPMPSVKDMRRAAAQYEEWWIAEHPTGDSVFTMPVDDCLHAILEHFFRYLWIHCGQIEFDPLRQMEQYISCHPPVHDATTLRLVQRALAAQELSEFELNLLRGWLIELREKMNDFLHIHTPS